MTWFILTKVANGVNARRHVEEASASDINRISEFLKFATPKTVHPSGNNGQVGALVH